LLTREEMTHAGDEGDYYRIPADSRNLNYDIYFEQGNETVSRGWEYTSHNTRRLAKEELKEMLLKLDIVRDAISKRQEGVSL